MTKSTVLDTVVPINCHGGIYGLNQQFIDIARQLEEEVMKAFGEVIPAKYFYNTMEQEICAYSGPAEKIA